MVDNVYDDEGNLDTSIDYKYQWRLIADGEDSNSGTLRLMLNTDMELVYDIDVDNFGDGTDCTVVVGGDETDTSACSIASTASLVQTYANVSIKIISFRFQLYIIAFLVKKRHI